MAKSINGGHIPYPLRHINQRLHYGKDQLILIMIKEKRAKTIYQSIYCANVSHLVQFLIPLKLEACGRLNPVGFNGGRVSTRGRHF